MKNIGLLDDDLEEVKSIRRTIQHQSQKTGIDQKYGEKYSFVEYDANKYNSDLKVELIREIIEDINEGKLDTLIIDFKLMANGNMMNGTEIYDTILKAVPKFPCVILTQIVDDCRVVDYMDPDKIYDKRRFFSISDEKDVNIGHTSFEKVRNIFRNMEIYVEQRGELTKALERSQNEYYAKKDAKSLTKLVKTEEEISDFIPSVISKRESEFNAEQLKETVKFIREAKKLMEAIDGKVSKTQD